MNSSVAHDLFDQTNGVGSVGFVKEHHGVHFPDTILLSLLLRFLDEVLNIFFSRSTMYLHVQDRKGFINVCHAVTLLLFMSDVESRKKKRKKMFLIATVSVAQIKLVRVDRY
jgi:hypothetical protein